MHSDAPTPPPPDHAAEWLDMLGAEAGGIIRPDGGHQLVTQGHSRDASAGGTGAAGGVGGELARSGRRWEILREGCGGARGVLEWHPGYGLLSHAYFDG